jgi:hypothetical protein
MGKRRIHYVQALRADAVTAFAPRTKELIGAVLEEISFVSELQDFRVL